MIEIIASRALNSVQDLGRLGSRGIGVSTSGAMDSLALRCGNALLGNDERAAGIEVQTFPFSLRFETGTLFAVTGAECRATLGDRVLPPWWSEGAAANDVLTIAAPRYGARAYVTVAGGIDVPSVLGSRSTHLRNGFGGHDGRALVPGDRIALHRHACLPTAPLGAVPPRCLADFRVPAGEPLPIRAIPAGEHDLFPESALDDFWSAPWTITPQSDRGGYRLGGPPIKFREPLEMRSYGVIAGIVQVTPSGQPIIQLSDANTAGGYPRIAGVIEADLWRLGQAALGTKLRFLPVTYAAGRDARAPVAAYLADVRRVARLVGRRLCDAAPSSSQELETPA